MYFKASSLVSRFAWKVDCTAIPSRSINKRWSSRSRMVDRNQGCFSRFPRFAGLSHTVLVHKEAVSFFSSQGKGSDPKSFVKQSFTRRFGLIASGSLLLLSKGQYILGALKLSKLATLGSMFVTIGTYSMFFGLPYAAGAVGLIFIHETGHALVMVHRGIPFSPMIFIPFVGAAVAMNRKPRDAWEEALVAFGGPVLGSAGALACSLGANVMDSQLLYALADFGFTINLFNLLPIGFMDGGRIAGALSPYVGVAGLGLGGALLFNGTVQNPIFLLILMAGGFETFNRIYNSGNVPINYYKISPMQRAALTGGYFGLIGALVGATALNDKFRKPPEELHGERFWDERH